MNDLLIRLSETTSAWYLPSMIYKMWKRNNPLDMIKDVIEQNKDNKISSIKNLFQSGEYLINSFKPDLIRSIDQCSHASYHFISIMDPRDIWDIIRTYHSPSIDALYVFWKTLRRKNKDIFIYHAIYILIDIEDIEANEVHTFKIKTDQISIISKLPEIYPKIRCISDDIIIEGPKAINFNALNAMQILSYGNTVNVSTNKQWIFIEQTDISLYMYLKYLIGLIPLKTMRKIPEVSTEVSVDHVLNIKGSLKHFNYDYGKIIKNIYEYKMITIDEKMTINTI